MKNEKGWGIAFHSSNIPNCCVICSKSAWSLYWICTSPSILRAFKTASGPWIGLASATSLAKYLENLSFKYKRTAKWRWSNEESSQVNYIDATLPLSGSLDPLSSNQPFAVIDQRKQVQHKHVLNSKGSIQKLKHLLLTWTSFNLIGSKYFLKNCPILEPWNEIIIVIVIT